MKLGSFYNMPDQRIITLLHQFTLGDVEDPYLFAALPISEWQKTEKGQWCMSHASIDPIFSCYPIMTQWGYEVAIYGNLTPEDYSYFQLRWGFDDNIGTR